MPAHEDTDKMLGSCPDFAVFHRGIRASSGAARSRNTGPGTRSRAGGPRRPRGPGRATR